MFFLLRITWLETKTVGFKATMRSVAAVVLRYASGTRRTLRDSLKLTKGTNKEANLPFWFFFLLM